MERHRDGSSYRLDDEGSQALEEALFGTSQHLMAVVDSDQWRTPQGRAELLTDIRKRLQATSVLIGEWLKEHST